MAEEHPDNSRSPESRAVLVSSATTSAECSTTGFSDLQPLSASRALSLSQLASYTVPIRLDALFFLINNASGGAQNVLPSLHGGQMSLSHCHGPAVRQPSCCSCCHTAGCAQPHGGTYPSRTAERSFSGYGGSSPAVPGGYGGPSPAVPGSQSSGPRWPSNNQQGGGKIWPTWNRDRSRMSWTENPQQEGAWRGQGNSGRGSWQGRQANSGRSWGDRRQGMGDSASWKSGQQDFRREVPFGSNAGTSSQRNQEGKRRQMMWDVLDTKRHSDDPRMGRQKSQEKQQPMLPKAVGAGPAKQVAQDSGEDWEADYESKPAAASAPAGTASHLEYQAGTSETCENQNDPPNPEPSASPPKLTSKDQGSSAAEKEPAKSHAERSKNCGFASYLKSLYSDPNKSGSDSSSNLIIDLDLCEEEQSPKTGPETVD